MKYINLAFNFIGSAIVSVGVLVCILLISTVLILDCAETTSGYDCEASIAINN